MKTLLAVAILAFALPSWAQAQYQVDLEICRAQSQAGLKVKKMGNVMQEIAQATEKCMAEKGHGHRASPEQLRQIQLHKDSEAVCGATAANRAELEKLSGAARAHLFRVCMLGHGYQ